MVLSPLLDTGIPSINLSKAFGYLPIGSNKRGEQMTINVFYGPFKLTLNIERAMH